MTAPPALRFDGIDVVALEVPQAEPLLGLYRDQLGFAIASDEEGGATGDLGALLGLERPVIRAVQLTRGDASGGALLLVETGCPPAGPADVPARRPGPYALDFYLRDAASTEARLAESGWRFTSEAVRYPLPGTHIEVREHMLHQPHSGLLHALVQHRPGGTRSVLGDDETGVSSEVVAVVVLTADLPAARALARDVLGGREYFAGVFAGPEVEEMLGFPPGHGLDAALFRGPGSRNARLEFARPVDGAGRPVALVAGAARPAVVPTVVVADVDEVADRLRAHPTAGAVSAPYAIAWGGRPWRGVRLDTPHDLSLCVLQPGRP